MRSTSPELLPEDFVDTLITESLKVPARVWQQTLRGLIDTDLRANLKRITAPTLLIAGDGDSFASDDQQAMLDAIPRARLTLYRGVGHGVHLAYPKRVVSDIVDFLASTTSSPLSTGTRNSRTNALS